MAKYHALESLPYPVWMPLMRVTGFLMARTNWRWVRSVWRAL